MNLNLVILFAVLALTVSPLDAKWHVHVVNGLSNNQVLFVHCKSGDDDLGEHNLTVGAETTWAFNVNIWQTTLYWCYVRQIEAKLHATFEAFQSSTFIIENCNDKTCIWTAKDDAIYLRNSDNVDESVKEWTQEAMPTNYYKLEYNHD